MPVPAPKVEIVHPGDGWVLDRLARILIERVPGAYSSIRRSQAGADTEICYFIHQGLFGPSRALVRGCFLPHKEPPSTLYDTVAAAADFCVAMSGPSLADCLAINPNSHLIYPGIDLQAYRPRLRIGFVGREYPSGRKGSAIFGFLRSLDYVELHCTDGKLRDDEIPGFIAGMDYILIASRYEGGPLCLLEALASGKPVIATEVGLVADYRHAPGVLTYPYEDQAALRRLLEAELDKRLLLRRTVEAHSEARYADAHAALFRRVLGR